MNDHEIKRLAEEAYNYAIETRRWFHTHPELSNQEHETTSYIIDHLEQMGIPYVTPAPTGVIGVIRGSQPGKILGIRADIDALPIQEESGLPFASSTDGKAHCCGHDLHTAMLLGAAKLLKERESELTGTVKLLFQPGEENMKGAKAMIRQGILESPHVDAAMAIHVNSVVPTGKLLVFTGPACASSDLFTIKIKGRGGHGSTPNKTIDPLNVAAHILISLQELQARELKAGETGVLTIGSIQGGDTFNVIPSEAVMKGTIRTYSSEVQELLIRRMKEICDATAMAFRAEAEVIFDPNYAIPLLSDAQVAADARSYLADLFPQDQIKDIRKSFPGSEDFAFISEKVPSVFIVLGANVVPGTPYGQHHPKVVFHEDCLPIGAAAHAQIAMEWLKHHQ